MDGVVYYFISIYCNHLGFFLQLCKFGHLFHFFLNIGFNFQLCTKENVSIP